jgi:hypothetical protein
MQLVFPALERFMVMLRASQFEKTLRASRLWLLQTDDRADMVGLSESVSVQIDLLSLFHASGADP